MFVPVEGKNAYIYRHTIYYMVGTVGIPGGILLGIFFLFSGGSILALLFGIGISIASRFLRKFEHEGVIIDLNENKLSYPQFRLTLKDPYPRTEIPISEIKSVSGYTTVQITEDSKIKRTHDLTIYGDFGYKKFFFYTIEERNQFYSLLSSVGQFETIG
jgi:hypothetical protein